MHEPLVTNKERELFCTKDIKEILNKAGVEAHIIYLPNIDFGEICNVTVNGKDIFINVTGMSLFHILITIVNEIKEVI